MHKIWKWLFVSLLGLMVMGIVIFSILVNNFHLPGVHIRGKNAHIALEQDCYFIDTSTMQVEGKSQFRMSGYLFDQFSGFMQVSAYPMSPDLVGREDTGGVVDNDELIFTNRVVQQYADWEYFYTVYIMKSEPNVVVILIQTKDRETITAVCGETEEEAIANYRAYRAALDA